MLVQFEHRAGITAAMPADVEWIHQPAGPPKVAYENCGAGLGHASRFRQQIARFRKVVEHRITHDEIKRRAGKSEMVAIVLVKFDAAGRFPYCREVRAGLRNHVCGAIDADQFPKLQFLGKLDRNLSGTTADIERAAAFFASDQAKRVGDEGIVDFFKEGLRGRGSVCLYLGGIVHYFGFWGAAEIEQAHKENPVFHQ